MLGQETSQEKAPVIQVEVQRVDVGAIVTDARGNFVKGLARDHFHLFDDGIEQPIPEFTPIEEPGEVLLLIEAGPAVYLLRDAHLMAADELLRGLNPNDKVAIVRYAEEPAGVIDFTADKSAARAALNGVAFNLGFGLLNLSQSLNTVLNWIAQLPGKKSIVLLTTGVDTSAPAAASALIERLRIGDVRLFSVSLTGPLRNGKSGNKKKMEQVQQDFAQADALLRTLAEATGGRAFFPENAKQFREAFSQVASLMRNEYSLAFVPAHQDGQVHAIDLRVDPLTPPAPGKSAPGYRVDHRQAYRAPHN